MLETVQNIGMQVCQWDDAPFFLFSDNVFSNLIYYSHLLPAIVSTLFGLLILFSDRKKLINKVLFFIMMSFTMWSLADLVLWATERIGLIMFMWSSLTYLEVIIFISCFYLVYLFIYRKDLSFGAKLALSISVLPVVLLAPTALNLTGFDFTNCEREAIEGPLWYYIYTLEIVIIGLIASMGLRSFFGVSDASSRRQNGLMVTGVLFFLLALSLGNIIGSFSEDWSIAQYGLFGMPIFTVLLSYLVVRYQRFNTKVFTTQIITVGLWVLILSILFIQDVSLIYIIVGLTLALAIVFGNILNSSVSKEIRQREEIKKYADDLERTNMRLRELDIQKNEFLSFATHQIRSPLASMKGYASLILEGDVGPISEDMRKMAQTILTSANTLARVVEDYLNITRIELGTMRYDMKQIDFAELVKEVINEQKPSIEAKGLSFSVSIDSSQSYPIRADVDKFKQVLMNTVDNSLKYTAAGSLSLKLEKDTAHGFIRFSVTDTGVGIAHDVMPKLFRKFSRASNASEANIHGTGLGLFIAKEVVTAHGGRIWAESEGEGKGSTFHVDMREVK